MKAVVLEKPGVVKVAEFPVPDCPDGGMLVRVDCCALCSSDLRMVKYGHRVLRYPVILGHEICGTVIENRQENGEIEPGDRIVVAPGISCGTCRYCREGKENLCPDIEILGFNHPGGLTEVLAVPGQMIQTGWVAKIPGKADPMECCLAEPLGCCLNGYEKLRIKAEDKVLIIGGGSIGCIHAWLCKLKGARRVYIVEKDSRRHGQLEQLGVSGLCSCEEDVRDSFDILILACRYFPGPEFLKNRIAPGAKILFFSGVDENCLSTFAWGNLIHYREWQILGAYGCKPRQIKEAIRLICHEIVPVRKLIGARYSLKEIHTALKTMEELRVMKVVIKPQE